MSMCNLYLVDAQVLYKYVADAEIRFRNKTKKGYPCQEKLRDIF